MDKFQVIRDTGQYTTSVGLEPQRGNEIFAIMTATMYYQFKLHQGSGLIKTSEMLDTMLQAGFDFIDNENIAEVFFLGFKYNELINIILNQPKWWSLLHKIGAMTVEGDDIQQIYEKLLPHVRGSSV